MRTSTRFMSSFPYDCLEPEAVRATAEATGLALSRHEADPPQLLFLNAMIGRRPQAVPPSRARRTPRSLERGVAKYQKHRDM
jgi:hypothetical protein